VTEVVNVQVPQFIKTNVEHVPEAVAQKPDPHEVPATVDVNVV